MATEAVRRRFVPAPLAPVALAAIAGVVIDRYAMDWETRSWALLALAAACLAIVARRFERVQRYAIVAAFVMLGAGRHHHRWSDLARDDLARSISETPRVAWLRGVLADSPEFHPSEQPDESGYTRVELRVTAISDGQDWYPISGIVRMTITGDRTDIKAGAEVTAAGTLGRIEPPTNPGEMDYQARARAQGVRLRMTVGEPQSVEVLAEGSIRSGKTWLLRARSWSRDRLMERLDPEIAPLAAALVLGHRDAVDPEVNDAFARTGTTHLLAISGLHLQVLAVAFGLAFRALGLGLRTSAAGVLLVIFGYALLVGGMPSVVRSTAMTLAYCAAVLAQRPIEKANVLASAAIITLLYNPADIFDAGCQLSYLAVVALFWIVPLVRSRLRRPLDPLDLLERAYEARWKTGLRRAGSCLVDCLVASLVVWIAALPLVALWFHQISPIGILLNLPLIPMTSLALLLAGCSLALSAIWWPLGGPFAWACGLLLVWTESLVRWGATLEWGSFFTMGPSVAWTLCFYGLPALGLVLARAGRPRRRWALGGLAAIALVLFGVASAPESATGPAVEVLDVGHGLAVLIQDAPGRGVLYDCGKLRDEHVGRRRIAPAIWARGVRRLDLIVLSHADADHFDGLEDILDRFPVAAIATPPGFGGPDNPAANHLLEMVRSRRIPIRTLAAGDRLEWGSGLTAAVLHPPRDFPPETTDNARSLVLDVSAQGHRLLLTGDLEGPGLRALTALDAPARVDVLLAPHHGGRTANPPWLYDWALPRLVVVSQREPTAGTKDALEFLAGRDIPCLRTWKEGAIRLCWADSGINVSGFRDEAAPLRFPFMNIVDHAWFLGLIAMGVSDLMRNRWVVTLIGLAVGVLAFLVLAIVEWGAWVLVRPGGIPGEAEPPPWQPLSATSADGTNLAGAWLGNDLALGRTAILIHGFGEDRSVLRSRASALAQRGWNVALLDLRGRGRSGGLWTTFGAAESRDLIAWLDALATRVGSTFAPIVWGRSMGAAVALRAAVDEPRIRALVLEAPYADLRTSVAIGLGRKRLPPWLAGPILRRAGRIAGVALDRPSPIELAPRLTIPALVLHGEADAIAPPSEVQRLIAALPGLTVVIAVPEADHNEVFDRGGEALADRVAAFLDAAITRGPDTGPATRVQSPG